MKIGREQKIVHLFFMGKIAWRIKIDDPLKYAIKGLPNWFLINPLGIISRQSTPSFEGNYFFPISKHEALVTDNRLSFLVKKDLDLSRTEDFLPIIETYLRFLKNLSQQVTIPKDLAVIVDGGEVELTSPKELLVPHKCSIRKHHLDTSLNKSLVMRALKTSVGYEFPIHHEIVLEAISAFNQKDFRKAILYAIIAIETVANGMLEDEYQKKLKKKNKYLRVLSFAQAGGASIKKDPIFEYLSEKSDFKQCLHERPLYLMRKSLLKDDQTLYQKCISLYKIRNHLVHKGAPETNLAYQLDGENAKNAIECALSVFKWFGVKTRYVSPFDCSFVEL
ncbi:MAG: hypothetical protein PHV97_02635 [Candidatus Omnitrophica bacterium]|nr:hypothetical protein [Candidatus Omnitrophota bacterium]